MSRRLLLRLLSAAPATDHVSDAELLRRFVASNDSAALELVVHRHANAVWTTCRRMLRSEIDAEDAFQATFLVLLRKASDVRAPCVGGWLHGVAVNVSLKLRTRSARTSIVEPGHLAERPASHTEPPDAEALAAVHEELALLSERERLPVVLCDLEGLTHEAAAEALGWPVGTVSGRLSRARAKLRDRLTRRGLKPIGAMLPAVAAPPHLIPNVLNLTAGAAAPAIVFLAEGVLAMTATTTWKWVTAAILCVGVLGVGGVLAFAPGTQPAPDPTKDKAETKPMPAPAKDKPADKDWFPGLEIDMQTYPIKTVPTAFPELVLPPDPDPNDPKGREKRAEQLAALWPRLSGKVILKIEPNDDMLQKLLKARLHQGAQEFYRRQVAANIVGPPDPKEFHDCLLDMQAAATELWSGQPKELVPWLEELLLAAKEIERYAGIRVLNGSLPVQNLNLATRQRLKLETVLWKAKNKK
jgi:RNA polymerase sigma factor (sigma-70 family)